MSKIVLFFTVLFSGLLLMMAIFYQAEMTLFPVFSVLSLIVPLLFLVNLIFLIFWLFRKSRKLIIPLFSLLIAYMFFGSFYGIMSAESEGSPEDFDIMTFNTWGFNKNGWIDDATIGEKIVDFIKANDPDILCMQEFERSYTKDLGQFDYHMITPESSKKTTQAIFSKYPIVSQGSVKLPQTINNIIYVDILMDGDTLRVYNIHLESFKIVPSRESFSEEESEKTYKRLVNTFEKQMEQANLFDQHRASCPYPHIVSGDMNNTQFSNVYRKVKGELQDSFLEEGTGFGKTYSLLGIPIRIDYVLPDDSFEVIGHENYYKLLSDHFPVMATLRKS